MYTMYTDYNINETHHAHRAHEIDLRVRETEKKIALMNARNRGDSTGSASGILRKTAKRIATLVAGLF